MELSSTVILSRNVKKLFVPGKSKKKKKKKMFDVSGDTISKGNFHLLRLYLVAVVS